MSSAADFTGLNPDILWRVVGDEALLLDTISGNYFSMDRVATEIFVKLNDGTEHDAIASEISTKYSVTVKRSSDDIDDLMSELRDAGIWR